MGQIYKITHKETGKCYIGQTKRDLNWRLNNSFCGHFTRATSDCSRSHIANAIHKYGKEAFTYEVIEECNNDKLDEREIYWIAFYDSYNNGYNQNKGGNNTISLKGRKMTWSDKIWETRRKNGTLSHEAWNKGKTWEELYGTEKAKEMHEKDVARKLGKKLPPRTEEYCEKMRLNAMGNTNCLGKKCSDEHKAKISKALKGKKQDIEQTQKMVNTRRMNNSYTYTEEQLKQRREKMKQKGTNIVSDETKKKLSEAGKKRWQKYKDSITINKEIK